jgi:hypothetical protein
MKQPHSEEFNKCIDIYLLTFKTFEYHKDLKPSILQDEFGFFLIFKSLKKRITFKL